MSNSTSNDEYSARVRETDDASEKEGTLSGRPFEVRSATGGLFLGLLFRSGMQWQANPGLVSC
jgi:hypothetical protein